MQRNVLVPGLALVAATSMLLPATTTGAEMAIRQEGYLYQLPHCQPLIAETFVIGPAPSAQPPQEPAQSPAPGPAPTPAVFTDPLTIYFPIDSATVDPEKRSKLLARLQELDVAPEAPLVVTGYTCNKGPATFNRWLSRQRAQTIARLLEETGYTVARVKGMSDADLVSTRYPSLNRRVEITALPNIPAADRQIHHSHQGGNHEQ